MDQFDYGFIEIFDKLLNTVHHEKKYSKIYFNQEKY